MARVVVLRQMPEAEETAAEIRARGHDAVLLPLARTVPLDAPPPFHDVGGFVVTSLQAVRALAAAFPGDPRPVLAVGARTAEALTAAGFGAVEAGPGTAEGLVARAEVLARESGRPLLYAAGRVRTPDFEAGAGAAGVALLVWEVYDVEPLDPGPAGLAAAFPNRESPDVLVLSVGQAEGFAQLWRRIAAEGRSVPRLLCLSERILRALPVDLRPFACISPQPKLSSLFDRFLPLTWDGGIAGDDRMSHDGREQRSRQETEPRHHEPTSATFASEAAGPDDRPEAGALRHGRLCRPGLARDG
ncbi:uroporphyrinogen-III synthase [Aureimonas sp. Leaf454]|uniref:uroporphyrinogen-III synthase n=1 Tax=Aureimonas sp. Leaf454 TaxID=1736381 RepID=UPI0009EB318D|nr:uroporphyrinogen-III synthase [Aureimonas sp. Leaf454]